MSEPDPVLYTFMVGRLAAVLERALLRIDRLIGGRRIPLGAWSTFANHGTVNRSTFPYYNADHHAAAARVLEAAARRAGRVPRHLAVVNVYGNSDAGDVSAGLTRFGPAVAEEVGRREAAAMFAAWRRAGRRLARRPRLALRWTRVCFCGQQTPTGRLADHAVFGVSYLTGSEEGRGPCSTRPATSTRASGSTPRRASMASRSRGAATTVARSSRRPCRSRRPASRTAWS